MITRLEDYKVYKIVIFCCRTNILKTFFRADTQACPNVKKTKTLKLQKLRYIYLL